MPRARRSGTTSGSVRSTSVSTTRSRSTPRSPRPSGSPIAGRSRRRTARPSPRGRSSPPSAGSTRRTSLICPAQTSSRVVQFHTTDWPDDLDLTGKRVAVIGTGATAVQIVPEIADRAAELVVFQRSPVWVGAKRDDEYSEAEREEFRRNPAGDAGPSTRALGVVGVRQRRAPPRRHRGQQDRRGQGTADDRAKRLGSRTGEGAHPRPQLRLQTAHDLESLLRDVRQTQRAARHRRGRVADRTRSDLVRRTTTTPM